MFKEYIKLNAGFIFNALADILLDGKMATEIRVGKLSYDPNKLAGRGRFGTVFKCLFTTDTAILAAVKRIQKSDVANKESFLREVEIMQKGSSHPNILRFICTEENAEFL